MVTAYIDYEQVLTGSTTECKTKEEMQGNKVSKTNPSKIKHMVDR